MALKQTATAPDIPVQRNPSSATDPYSPRDQFRPPADQQPPWPDIRALRETVEEISACPPLVFAEECDRLRTRLAAAARGDVFVLQGGDCAETFDALSADSVSATVETLLQMASVLSYAGGVPVCTIGRIAGQYAKPRSKTTEIRDGVELPVYRGDAVNGTDFTAHARTPDPRRLERAYHASSVTLNLIRAFLAGGQADPHRLHSRNRAFVDSSPAARHYAGLATEIEGALRFITSCGYASPARAEEFYVSHEALLLDYERALARIDSRTGHLYGTSGHLLWIGERTRHPRGPHVAFARAVRNPVAVKLGPSATPEEAVELARRLCPEREPGRLTFVTRMGADAVRHRLPPIVEKVTTEGYPVTWLCDPMHGNTFTTPTGLKTRHFDDVMGELAGFFEVHARRGTHPGGLHLELTGDHVTECLGGGEGLLPQDLHRRYETACDPRLGRGQALDLAFRTAELRRCAADAGAAVATRG